MIASGFVQACTHTENKLESTILDMNLSSKSCSELLRTFLLSPHLSLGRSLSLPLSLSGYVCVRVYVSPCLPALSVRVTSKDTQNHAS